MKVQLLRTVISFKRNIFKTGYKAEKESSHALYTLLLVGKVEILWDLTGQLTQTFIEI